MNTILNFKSLLAGSLLLAATVASAQNEIQSTQTDEKYGNTTVIYTKGKPTNDAAILAQLDDSYGIGDVIRITEATPQNNTSQMVASTDNAMMFASEKKTVQMSAPKTVAVKPAPKVAVTEKKPVAEPVVAVQKVAAPAAKVAPKMMKKGVIYLLEKVYFDTNKSELKAESDDELNSVLAFLEDHPEAVIEVRGHTNNLMWPNADFANELSTGRAKAVAEWLIAKGVAASRIQYKGFGWTMPILPNINAEGRKKNQRVEVKVLSM